MPRETKTNWILLSFIGCICIAIASYVAFVSSRSKTEERTAPPVAVSSPVALTWEGIVERHFTQVGEANREFRQNLALALEGADSCEIFELDTKDAKPKGASNHWKEPDFVNNMYFLSVWECCVPVLTRRMSTKADSEFAMIRDAFLTTLTKKTGNGAGGHRPQYAVHFYREKEVVLKASISTSLRNYSIVIPGSQFSTRYYIHLPSGFKL
jgi:hypothetical protein